ncbi:MAG: glycosyltransferase family 25 protein [Crocinitomicaceae bacterium]|nr:glycosyltransferase family 25 protein [Crocinitomicaceae bacterium]
MTNPYVINLDERTDRWEQIQKEWKGYFNLTRVSAVRETPGWKGCSLSHIKIIEEAKSRGDPYVLIWEDDCIPRKHPKVVRELWDEILCKLSHFRDRWDIVLGATSRAYRGATHNPTLSSQRVKIYDLPHGFTTHWTLYNSSCYDKMIEYKNTLQCEIDVFMYQTCNVKVVIPFLAQQRKGYSDIECLERDYSEWFDDTENKLLNKQGTLNSILRGSQMSSPKFIAR